MSQRHMRRHGLNAGTTFLIMGIMIFFKAAGRVGAFGSAMAEIISLVRSTLHL
jgi:hypothetical protein